MEIKEGKVIEYNARNGRGKVAISGRVLPFHMREKQGVIQNNDAVFVRIEKSTGRAIVTKEQPALAKGRGYRPVKATPNPLTSFIREAGIRVHKLTSSFNSKKQHPKKLLSTADIPHFDNLWNSSGKDIFSEKYDFLEWLTTPNGVINNEVPIKLLTTESGLEQVKRLLIRLEYGVMS